MKNWGIVVSLRGVNQGFWARLGVDEGTQMFSAVIVSFRVYLNNTIIKIKIMSLGSISAGLLESGLQARPFPLNSGCNRTYPVLSGIF